MPWVGFEPTIPAFERANTVHALDRAAAVIGCDADSYIIIRNTIYVQTNGSISQVDFTSCRALLPAGILRVNSVVAFYARDTFPEDIA
jgi:hypothetical protein